MSRRPLEFGKLSDRKSPECGSLARRDQCPKDSTVRPILEMPAEVRLLIWKHLLDEVTFSFDLESDGLPGTCYTDVYDYRLTSFLQTCKLFRREGLALARPTSLRLTSQRRLAIRRSNHYMQNVGPKCFPLLFDDVCASVTHIDIEAAWGLAMCNATSYDTKPLSKFSKLETINVLHSSSVDLLENQYDGDHIVHLSCPKQQIRIVQKVMGDEVQSLASHMEVLWDRRDGPVMPKYKIIRALHHLYSQMTNITITLQADITPANCDTQQDLLAFPLFRQVERLQLVLEVPSMQIHRFAAELYNKAIEFAIKQRWIETIPIDDKDTKLRHKLLAWWSSLA